MKRKILWSLCGLLLICGLIFAVWLNMPFAKRVTRFDVYKTDLTIAGIRSGISPLRYTVYQWAAGFYFTDKYYGGYLTTSFILTVGKRQFIKRWLIENGYYNLKAKVFYDPLQRQIKFTDFQLYPSHIKVEIPIIKIKQKEM